MRPERRGFNLVTTQVENGHRTSGRFHCGECGKTLDIPIAGNGTLIPEHCAKMARARGWVAHAFRMTGTYCPRCAGAAAKPKNDVDSELKKVFPMSITPIKTAVEIRDATLEQKVAIRHQLDKSFDDAAGCYLDGLSDQSIADMVKVPRIVVERIRETAYGPIRVDPVLTSLRTELGNIRVALDAQQRSLEELQARQARATAALEKHLGVKVA